MRPASFEVLEGDAAKVLAGLPAGSVQAVVTSPPYYGLRDYGHPGQLGDERTVGEYVERLVAVFEQVHRVLRDDGVVWLNLGDSYATAGGDRSSSGLAGAAQHERGAVRGTRRLPSGLKPKDLIGVPWRVAFALQDTGWWLRKDVIWDKPDPMPESTRDRPTSSHEHVFLLTKAPRYFYDVDGFREPSVSTAPAGNGYKREHRVGHGGQGERASDDRWQQQDTRQLRDVWRIPLQPFPGAHFAVFPPALPRRCILLSTSPRACDRCRAPFARIVERKRLLDGEPVGGSWQGDGNGHRIGAEGVGHWRFSSERRTLGWRPTCACGAPHGVESGDLEEIETPSGAGGTEDPSPLVGRAGLARPRGEDAGTRSMTRWEQRHLARQLAGSPHREAMEAEAGREAFAHYLRSDRSGARPPRPDLLDAWCERGWVHRVDPPAQWWTDDDQERCVVLDPFAGAGTTGLVAVDEGRDFIGVELNPDFAEMARSRIAGTASAPRLEFLT